MQKRNAGTARGEDGKEDSLGSCHAHYIDPSPESAGAPPLLCTQYQGQARKDALHGAPAALGSPVVELVLIASLGQMAMLPTTPWEPFA